MSGDFGGDLWWNSIQADEVIVEAEEGVVEGFGGEARISDGDGRIDVVWCNSFLKGLSIKVQELVDFYRKAFPGPAPAGFTQGLST